MTPYLSVELWDVLSSKILSTCNRSCPLKLDVHNFDPVIHARCGTDNGVEIVFLKACASENNRIGRPERRASNAYELHIADFQERLTRSYGVLI